MSKQSVDALRAEFDNFLEKNELSHTGQANGCIMIEDKLYPEIFNLVDIFREKAKDYFKSPFVKTEIIYFQKSKKEVEEKNIPGGSFHLDDVSKENEPFVYAENTHGPFSSFWKNIPMVFLGVNAFKKISLYNL